MAAESNTDDGRSRQESVGTSSVGQQLPSLSSLFGPPSAMRPLNSPHTERHGIYPSPSPLDRPRLSSSGNLSSSYFPQTISPSPLQSRNLYDTAYNYHDRQSTHAPTSSFPGPQSPEYSTHNHIGPDARYEPEMPRKWSAYREDSRQDYQAAGSRDSSYLQSQDKLRLHLPGQKDPAHDYSERRPSQVPSSDGNPPSTSATSMPSDIAVSKDGLGPKIWTGTHFLPRFVRAAEVPGEGMCYFYDDGSHCKTVIDGEAVNAHWGVTKAGKPRKRLAIACVTCREKKIKCDPDYPRCVQCEKFGRICKFKNASPRAMQPPSPDRGYSKRLKLGPEAYISNGEPPASFNRRLDYLKPRIAEPAPPPLLPEPSKIPDDVLGRAWRTDPFASTPDLITSALSRFFANVDSTMILQFLPEEVFQRWVVTSVGQKSPEDLMLLYSILAVGSALCGDPKHIAFEYAQVAHYAQRMTGVQCLQLVQSKILLAVYYISTCRAREADELISSAAAGAACLQLSLELDHSRESVMTVYPLGLNRTGYAEARRRTLWSLFMLERLGGLFPERPPMTNAEDIYIRLPADLNSFEKQAESHARTFDPYCGRDVSDERSSDTTVTGYYLEMVHIWSDCQASIYRMASRRTSTEADTKLQDLVKRAKNWAASLPSRMTFGGANIESAAFTRSTGSFLSMHFLYHHTMIELNRHRYGAGQLPKDVQLGHSAECREHASRVLEMLNSLERILRVRSALLSIPPPAMAVAVTEAVDVLTASGPMAVLGEVIDRVRIAQSAVDKMKDVWEASSKDGLAIHRRLQKLNRIRELGSRPPSPIQGYRLLPLSDDTKEKELSHWQIFDPLEQTFPRDMDVIYVGFD
ncbi:N-terminal binuclear Zn cluster-containing/DNA binding domain-containing protein [Trichoderma citrinoviride]|uniref:N-terminal binuclear Zn cluster-containing/DNA binding domain-containing protein n=1 Tax=Trichoderma citrinoviride TaxID=58853 RepID=A0A2T4B0J1_9HYPO|nr:N-terminal binuclear Zn cluster-containing/DNA binding domain-containing protein [Trichoderma citrinoviride]PTB62843.1 N-terminal binuclear Zn cluster-containing/DNA binding domain-containing protein [Trichoderma citrinoviride]